jgi:hypothetical protein
VSRVTTPEARTNVVRTVYEAGKEADGDRTEYEEVVSVPLFNTEVARVMVLGGVTRNVGDFNFVKVEVSVDMPCYPETSEMDRAYNLASDIVEEKIQRELDFATGVNPDDGANGGAG